METPSERTFPSCDGGVCYQRLAGRCAEHGCEEVPSAEACARVHENPDVYPGTMAFFTARRNVLLPAALALA